MAFFRRLSLRCSRFGRGQSLTTRPQSDLTSNRAPWTENSHEIEVFEEAIVNAEKKFASNSTPAELLELAASLASIGRAYLTLTMANGMVPISPFRARALLKRALTLQNEQLSVQDLEIARTSLALAHSLRYLQPINTELDCGGVLPLDSKQALSINGVSILSRDDLVTALSKHDMPENKRAGYIETLMMTEVPLGLRAPALRLLETSVPVLQRHFERATLEGAQRVGAPFVDIILELAQGRTLLGMVHLDFFGEC
jgi:hypothetical protein